MEIVKHMEEVGLQKELKVKDAILSGNSEVTKIYDGKVLFVTGGSGFLGKQLVEKILRTCNIKKMYLLLRPKKGKTVIQRLNQILEDPVYDLIRRDQPNFASKLFPVEGDVAELNLGISADDRKKITEEVNIIFHGAATINFGDPIKIATLTNLRGTRDVLNLAKTCKNLKSIVHISTAFVQATKSRFQTEIKEEIYKSPLPPDALIQLAENLDNDKLEAMMEPLKGDWPNTYTFTKAVTEDLVRENAECLPLCIVRPAIVTGAYREPTTGWVDFKNIYGPSGMLLGIALGVTHAVYADLDIIMDFIPVDIVNNALIVAAWDTQLRHSVGDKQIKIFVVTSTRNAIKFGDLDHTMNNEARPMSSPKAIWYCFALVTKNRFLYWLLTWLLHYIPGYVVDGICMLIGEKPRLIKVYKKAYALSSVFEYFTNNFWIFRDNNTLDLYNKLGEADKEIFMFDVERINMKDMLLAWFYGVSKHIIKDDPKLFEYSAKKQWWLRIANVIFLALYFYGLFKVFYLFCVYVYDFFNLFTTDNMIGTA